MGARVFLLKVFLIPHRTALALLDCAAAIDNAYLWCRAQWLSWRRPKVYGWKNNPAGGNYFDEHEVGGL
jgi:hypothetical protein